MKNKLNLNYFFFELVTNTTKKKINKFHIEITREILFVYNYESLRYVY